MLTQGEYPGTRIVFRSGIGQKLENIKRAQIIHLDIGIGDAVIPRKIDTPYILGEGTLSWLVYPPQTIVAEKLHAMISRGSANSRAKDLLDLNFLIPQCRPEDIHEAVIKTFNNRKDISHKKLTKQLSEIDFTLIRRGWKGACESLKESESFDEALKRLIEMLENYDL